MLALRVDEGINHWGFEREPPGGRESEQPPDVLTWGWLRGSGEDGDYARIVVLLLRRRCMHALQFSGRLAVRGAEG